MAPQWLRDGAKRAAASSGSWIALNPLATALIAVLILVAALGGWGRAIERGRMADGILKSAADNTAKLRQAQAAAEVAQRQVEELQERVRQADRSLAESRRKLEEARRIARGPFRKPTTGGELLDRYRALGYRGRVK